MLTDISKRKLTNIIEKENGVNWWNRELFLKNIKNDLPSELEIISLPPEYENNYNCFVYALGLENDKDFLGNNNPIQQDFIKYLLKMNLVTETDKKTGNIILYLNSDSDITHAGIMENEDVVISKWMWGPIIRNNCKDVPSSFGDQIIFVNKLNSESVKALYLQYKAMGIEIKPIS
jgi:hypothetical protein